MMLITVLTLYGGDLVQSISLLVGDLVHVFWNFLPYATRAALCNAHVQLLSFHDFLHNFLRSSGDLCLLEWLFLIMADFTIFHLSSFSQKLSLSLLGRKVHGKDKGLLQVSIHDWCITCISYFLLNFALTKVNQNRFSWTLFANHQISDL